MAATNSIDALFAPSPAATAARGGDQAARGGDQASRATGGERFEPSLAKALQAKPVERRSAPAEKPEAPKRDDDSTSNRSEQRPAPKVGAPAKKSAPDCQKCDVMADDADVATVDGAADDDLSDENQDAEVVAPQTAVVTDAVKVAAIVQPTSTASIDEVLVVDSAEASAPSAEAANSASEQAEQPEQRESPSSPTGATPTGEAVEEVETAAAAPYVQSPNDAVPEFITTVGAPADDALAVAEADDAVVVVESSGAESTATWDNAAKSIESEPASEVATTNQDDELDAKSTEGAKSDGKDGQDSAGDAPAPLRVTNNGDSGSTTTAITTSADDVQNSGEDQRVRRTDKKTSTDKPPGDPTPAGAAPLAPTADVPAADAPIAPSASVGAVAAVTSTPRGATTIERVGSAQFTDAAQRADQDEVPGVDRNRFLQRVEGAFKAAQQRDGRIHVRLSPPELGALRIEMIMQNGALTARIEAETPAARTTLLDNLPALRERLAQQEIRIEKFDVDVRRDGGGSSGSTGQQSPEGQSDQSAWRDNGGRPRDQRPRLQAAAAPQRSAPGTRSTNPDGALDVRI